MDMLSLVYTISAVVGGGFLVWLNTKSGKKWLANLWCTSHWRLRVLWMH